MPSVAARAACSSAHEPFPQLSVCVWRGRGRYTAPICRREARRETVACRCHPASEWQAESGSQGPPGSELGTRRAAARPSARGSAGLQPAPVRPPSQSRTLSSAPYVCPHFCPSEPSRSPTSQLSWPREPPLGSASGHRLGWQQLHEEPLGLPLTVPGMGSSPGSLTTKRSGFCSWTRWQPVDRGARPLPTLNETTGRAFGEFLPVPGSPDEAQRGKGLWGCLVRLRSGAGGPSPCPGEGEGG